MTLQDEIDAAIASAADDAAIAAGRRVGRALHGMRNAARRGTPPDPEITYVHPRTVWWAR